MDIDGVVVRAILAGPVILLELINYVSPHRLSVLPDTQIAKLSLRHRDTEDRTHPKLTAWEF